MSSCGDRATTSSLPPPATCRLLARHAARRCQGPARAEDLAARLDVILGGERTGYGQAGVALGVNPNRLRYAAATGRVLIRWDGARQADSLDRPPPDPTPRCAPGTRPPLPAHLRPGHARGLRPLGRDQPAGRYRRVRGARLVADSGADADRRRMHPRPGRSRLPRRPPGPAAPARLLPSGDAYFLLHGADRDLLVPEADKRNALWTPRVWPGALLIGGEIAGTWRRADTMLTVQPWRRLSPQNAMRSRRRQSPCRCPVPAAGSPSAGTTGTTGTTGKPGARKIKCT